MGKLDEGPGGGRSEAPRSSFGDLVGRSPAMRAVFAECARVAATDTSVYVSGEAGTGKHLLARSLHGESARRAGPFVVLDCSLMPTSELAGELFGRADGETRGRAGALESAHKGTLLLEEPADLPLALQTRLQHALARREFSREPVFARAPEGALRAAAALALDVRILTASRRKLAPELERGRLLPALWQSLAGVEVLLPPLRERREDVALLAQSLLARLPESSGMALSQQALNVLSLHDWPGNVRELRNVLERFAYALRDNHLGARRLATMLLSGELAAATPARPDERRAAQSDSSLARSRSRDDAGAFEPGLSYREERARFEAAFEQRYVTWLLARHDGNVSAAARAAEMDRKYLHKLARKHGLQNE